MVNTKAALFFPPASYFVYPCVRSYILCYADGSAIFHCFRDTSISQNFAKMVVE